MCERESFLAGGGGGGGATADMGMRKYQILDQANPHTTTAHRKNVKSDDFSWQFKTKSFPLQCQIFNVFWCSQKKDDILLNTPFHECYKQGPSAAKKITTESGKVKINYFPILSCTANGCLGIRTLRRWRLRILKQYKMRQ